MIIVRTCDTCGAMPCTNPSFCRACRIADALRERKPPATDTFVSIADAAARALANIARK